MSPSQTAALIKQSNLLSRLGWGAAGAGSVLGGLALQDAVEDLQKTPSQLQLEQLLEQTQGMGEGQAQDLIASYLEQQAKRRYNRAKDIYNL